MRRRRVLSLLNLAAVALLAGCADSDSPADMTRDASRRTGSGETVVTAAHQEAVPQIDWLVDEAPFTHPLSGRQPLNAARRLPPIDPLPVSTSSNSAAQVARRFERLPDLNCAAQAESRHSAVDSREQEQSERRRTTALDRSIVEIATPSDPDQEPAIPRKRLIKAKAPKPPLPPLVTQAAAVPGGAPAWFATRDSLAAVSARADGTIERGFRLAEKGAYYSAKTEFNQALRTVAQALDAHFGGNHHSQALAAAWLALDEANDFSVHSQRGPVVDVSVIVDSHQTPALKDYALDGVSSVLAMQHYFSFAQEQLVEACGHAPVASRALHGLGKIHMVLGEKSASAERLHGPKAMAYQQAALTTDPRNYLAANELGVLLARFGKWPEARTVLQYALASYPLPETWQNLSVVHQRLGEAELAAQAMAQWQAAIQQTGHNPDLPQPADSQSMVQWVSPHVFAGQQPGLPNSPWVTQPARRQEPAAEAKKKSGFLWW